MNTRMQRGHSEAVTEDLRVRVAAQYIPEQSDPDRNRWIYAYRVILTNEGMRPATLVSRHWVIRDAFNESREVRGPGVVGKNPRLEPGQSFEYTSGCPLSTEWGTMEGSYMMKRDDGKTFEAEIGRFFLAPNVAPLSALGPAVQQI